MDLDIDNLPEAIELSDRYDKAFILLRQNKVPLGKIVVPVIDNQVITTEILSEIIASTGPALAKNMVLDYLGIDRNEHLSQSKVKATIAVCTRNRTSDLRKCIEGLLKLPDDGQEILIIDNCPSNNDTQLLVESFGSLRYVREDLPGLNNARNRALKEATHDVVAFTDDDAIPDYGWLRALMANFSGTQTACVTGLTLPLELETEGQEAFESYSPFSKGFKRVVHSMASRNPLATGQVGAGANMAIRKQIVQTIGFFDEALDAGTLTQSGGDHEFFLRILTAGYQIIYDPAALSWHRHRRTMEETKKAIWGYGVGVYAFWTRTLIEKGELGIIKLPINWFFHEQLRALIKSAIKWPGSHPFTLVWAELSGCIYGPWAYLASRKRAHKHLKNG
ncbi:glycosyltransferase family 2 protein [Segetibacter sp. 3557_3]|uniref:glycosyltransferase family 2 protein n=1 Tax=Segetibacter sp. 3557_3 TaxID=2547429 RepID=UPI001A9D9890|nr:glycosyltransferase [Segetibacter sp. 3557_3]